MQFYFLTDSQLLVKCRGPLRTAPALHKLTEVQTFCVQPEVLASNRSSGFQMFRGLGTFTAAADLSAQGVLLPKLPQPSFHFFSLPFCLPLV